MGAIERASSQCDLAMKRLARAACQQQQKPAMCLVQRAACGRSWTGRSWTGLPASGETRCLAAPPWRPQGRSAPAACRKGAGQTTDIWRQLRNHQKLRIQVIYVETQQDDRCSRGSRPPQNLPDGGLHEELLEHAAHVAGGAAVLQAGKCSAWSGTGGRACVSHLIPRAAGHNIWQQCPQEDWRDGCPCEEQQLPWAAEQEEHSPRRT